MRVSKTRGKHLGENIADLGYEVSDIGDVEIVRPGYLADDSENPRYLGAMLASFANVDLALGDLLHDGKLPVILGGDHSIAIGTFSTLASHYRNQGTEIGLIWFDAHADINTPETSPSGNIHGMPLGAILGSGNHQLVNLNGYAPKLKPEFLAHIGARDVDAGERKQIRELGLRDNFFTMSDIDVRGMA